MCSRHGPIVSPECAGSGSCRNGDTLNGHELQSPFGRNRRVQAQFDGIADTLDRFIEGLGLCVASGKLWD